MPSFDRSLAYYAEVPTWICEVLSPSTEVVDRVKKLRVYHQAGVKFAWLVHPEHRTLEVYEHTAGGYLLAATYVEEEAVTARPFEDHALDFAALWF